MTPIRTDPDPALVFSISAIYALYMQPWSVYLANGVPSASGLTGISMLGGCVRNSRTVYKIVRHFVCLKCILQPLQVQCINQI